MNSLTKERAAEIFELVKEQNIVVFGDVMLDEFVWGEVTRISPEAPVPVVEVRRESVHLGGAANVLANLVSLGARGSVIGIVGNDSVGSRIRAELHELVPNGAVNALVVENGRPSTLKTRIVAHNQIVVRADRETRAQASNETEDRLIEVLKAQLETARALIVSDYDKGAITPRVLKEILPLAHKNERKVVVDPKIRNFEYYRPATLISPNHHEALRLANLDDQGDEALVQAGRLIQQKLGSDSVLITRGDRGMMLLEASGKPLFVETTAREVYDVTGAGDTVVATVAAALAAGASVLEAAILANHAAGIVVGKVGTATAGAEEILDSIG